MGNKVTLSEFESTGDPMLDDNYEIIFSNLPDGIEAKTFRIHNKTATLPGCTVAEVVKEAFGYQLRYAGQKTWSGSFSLELNENAEAKILNQITAGVKVKLDDGSEEEHKIVKSKDQAAINNMIQWILSLK